MTGFLALEDGTVFRGDSVAADGFAVGEAVRQRYAEMFPGDPDARDLDHWERFEVAYPDTFFEMYKFICRA